MSTSALETLYRQPLAGSLVFDIETGPMPWEVIEKLVPPFIAPPHPGDFDASTVKVGNLTEANAIKKIEAKRAEHLAEVAAYEVTTAAARVAWEQKVIDGAALDASIGQVLAIGYRDARGNVAIDRCDGPQNERRLIENFWRLFVASVTNGHVLIGHYIGGFDIPFLIRRSWILGIDVPGLARDGRYLSRSFVDTRELWLCGERGGGSNGGTSLDAVARAMGVGSKEGQECSGATFWRYWTSGDDSLKRAALEYLANDLAINAGVAERMGVL